MIDRIKKMFGGVSKDWRSNRQRIQDIRVAACALLVEMSKIDGEFSDQERDGILRTMTEDFGLLKESAASLVDAADEELAGSRDLWEFTSLINRDYSEEEKIQIIEMVWRVAYADRRLDSHEDALVHKLAGLLHLTHRQLIDAKMRIIQSMGLTGLER